MNSLNSERSCKKQENQANVITIPPFPSVIDYETRLSGFTLTLSKLQSYVASSSFFSFLSDIRKECRLINRCGRM